MNEFVNQIAVSILKVEVQNKFMLFVFEHGENLPTDAEKENFRQLLLNNDDYSEQIMLNLWTEFKKEHLNDEAMKQMMNKILAEIYSE